MQQAAVAILVVVIMLAIGLRSAPADFRDALGRPGRLLWALGLNTVAIPLLALLAIHLVSLPEPVVVGLVLCAASPGGATGPLFAAQARGELALAVSAMVLLSMVSVLTAPPTISWLLGVSLQADVGALILPMMQTLALFQLLPLAMGMGIRRAHPALAGRLSGPLQALSNALLFAVILGLLVAKGQVLAAVGFEGLAVIVAMVLSSLLVGALAGSPRAARRSLVLVTGVRNISLALLLSASWFSEPLTDAAVLAYGLFTMLLPFALSWGWSRGARATEATD